MISYALFTNKFPLLELTSRIKVLLEKLGVSQLVKNFSHFIEAEDFITGFTGISQLSFSSARQSTSSCHVTLRFILILFSYLSLGCPSGLFPSDFPTKTLYAFIF